MSFQVAVAPAVRNEAGIAVVLPILHQRLGERFQRSAAVRQEHGATTPGPVPEGLPRRAGLATRQMTARQAR